RWTPTLDQVESQNVVVRVLDAQGGSATQSFTITVRAADAPPIITSTPPTRAGVNFPYSYAVRAIDAEGDPLTFTLPTAPAGMTIETSTGAIRWTPAADQLGSQLVSLQVSDSQGGIATQSYTILVTATPPNQPPTITSTAPTLATAGVLYSYDVAATDPEGDALQFALQTSPAGMTIDPGSGLIRWTPATAQVGN